MAYFHFLRSRSQDYNVLLIFIFQIIALYAYYFFKKNIPGVFDVSILFYVVLKYCKCTFSL